MRPKPGRYTCFTMALTLVSLTLEHLLASSRDPVTFCGSSVAEGALPPDFIINEAVSALERGDPQLWCSPFAFLDTDLHEVVGSGGFRGVPKAGRVEIGYGVAEKYRGQGYASAAARSLVALALAEPTVLEVYAETSVTNPASRRAVEKAGFIHAGQRQTTSDGLVDQWIATS